MLGLGFGFVEVGTVTPRPQQGNSKPRLFRLEEDGAVINRMGFNNEGQPAVYGRLQRCSHSRGVIGVNIGANKDSNDRIADYVSGVRAMSPVARYLTINISSPNTPGLRQLQDEGALRALLSAIDEARAGGPPIFLKVAPDLGKGEPDQIVRAAMQYRIDAIIVANTTVSRPPLKSRYAAKQGGLSGAPLKSLAMKALRDFVGRRRRNAADRRRWNCDCRGCVGAHPGGGEPGPALFARWSTKGRASPAGSRVGWPNG